MNDADAVKRRVAMRQFPGIAKEILERGEGMTVEETADRITAAIETDPTLREMGENRLDRPKALRLAEEVREAGTRVLKSQLARREIRRTIEGLVLGPAMQEQAERMDALDRGEPDPHPEQDAANVSELIDEFKKKGYL